MRRDYSQFFPLLANLLLFSALSYGQTSSGILAPSRAFDWKNAGLPATLPDGETSANPWTPPARTQCATSQCNTVTGGNVTAATINAAISSAPAGTFVLVPAGTFGLGGNITLATNSVTLRGSGASQTKLTGGGINVGGGYDSGRTLLTANPAKGATSITVQSPPSAGRIASLEQCDDGFSAANANFTHYGSGTNCIGSYSDPLGPWECGLAGPCARNSTGGGTSNPHFLAHVIWIPSGGVSGNTVNFTSPLANSNWSTARTAALVWLNVNGTAGAGIEDLTIVGSIGFNGTYACWIKGTRILTTSGSLLLSFHFDAHSLVANSYIASTVGGSSVYLIEWGFDGGEQAQSDHLFINNIIEGGFAAGFGEQVDEVFAYNYFYTSANTSWVENGEFQHHAGTSFLLREGNQFGNTLDDDTWATHNFNTWFRNYISGIDWGFPATTGPDIEIGGWARFDNLIGNAIGGGSASSSYSSVISVNGNGLDKTGLTEASLMRWGNYVVCSGGNAHCNTTNFDSAEVPTNLSSFGGNSTPFQNPVPADHSLPASFFMNVTAHPSGGTGLNWWKTCTGWTSFPSGCGSSSTPPMPPIGPDVTGGQHMSGHAWNIPAALAWASLPSDTNYPTSWGTLRQFDERVYQSDSGGGSSGTPGAPTPPTGLSVIVQ